MQLKRKPENLAYLIKQTVQQPTSPHLKKAIREIDLSSCGVRDEAKMLGGIGPCGRVLCCSSWLGDFEPVSIKMAKDQSLSLNPTKISGLCGRLMCCLKFEHDNYESVKEEMPAVGKLVITSLGEGKVVGIHAGNRTIHVQRRHLISLLGRGSRSSLP